MVHLFMLVYETWIQHESESSFVASLLRWCYTSWLEGSVAACFWRLCVDPSLRLLGAATEAIVAPGKVIAVAFLTNPILRERHSCKDGVQSKRCELGKVQIDGGRAGPGYSGWQIMNLLTHYLSFPKINFWTNKNLMCRTLRKAEPSHLIHHMPLSTSTHRLLHSTPATPPTCHVPHATMNHIPRCSKLPEPAWQTGSSPKCTKMDHWQERRDELGRIHNLIR